MSAPLLERDDARGLRRFALLLALVISAVFWGALPWLFDFARPLWPLLVSAGLAVTGGVAPRAIYPVYRGWMRVARPLAWVNTRLILGLAFFGLVVPAGWLLRRLDKLQYREGFDRNVASYRVERTRRIERNELERPY